ILPNGPNPDAQIDKAITPVRIDFDNIRERVFDLPIPTGDYSQLAVGKPGFLYPIAYEWPKSPAFGTQPTLTLYMHDLSKPPKLDKVMEEVRGAELSADGSRIFYTKGRGQPDFFLIPAGSTPKADEGKLDFKRLEVKVDPRAEWKQMYREAWRIMRDWFYDPNHHGQNLAELERHYGEYLPGIVRRSDFNSLMNRMLGHVSVSHLGVGGGDQPQSGQPDRTGMLGADYEIDQGRYRFKRIYRWSYFNSPSGFVPAPLDIPGNKVKEGEYLLAVNDQNVDATKSVYSYFEGKAGQPLKLKVGPNPSGDGSRVVSIFAAPAQSENQLRRANWSAQNRRRVEEISGGKLGYIYVDSYGPGIMDFIRGLVGYSDRPGMIIDQRFNGGGITPDYLIEWLQRRPLYYYTFREGDDIATPVNPGPQVKVLIVNENNFSAAETFAFMYKLAKVGPIVGLRTGGGGIGPYVFTPQLIDGGNVQLPNRAAYNPDGTSWGIENVGIIPDFEVEITPRDWMMGRDPQLEKAVQVALDELKKVQPVARTKPAYPVHK
ncbi:MAG TPA: S41 family peptidase, partial [Pyrinomonadaceae bacterium]|nr:S41 family peptidase [Pyrinomonadaceae bacterium]